MESAPAPAPPFPCCRPNPDVLSPLREGILNLLSRWTALQIAVQNQWGGHDSLKKSERLASDILSLLSQSKAPLHVEDLENLLHETLLLTFNTEIEDGSIEEVHFLFNHRLCFLNPVSRESRLIVK
ncbi:hypothetical protein RJ639_029031 [Escallonia herrerae]|uniref:Pre-rRNA-processing protein TSR2 homolog n=1 Tax=Escallonia herrerae TaxID=1293975 RepID=A0AA88XE11_9ASTE|nr:hypothetical protein RJ639_029031 [Escallonia herrerae]